MYEFVVLVSTSFVLAILLLCALAWLPAPSGALCVWEPLLYCLCCLSIHRLCFVYNAS